MFEILALIAIGVLASCILPSRPVSGEKHQPWTEADFQAAWALELKR